MLEAVAGTNIGIMTFSDHAPVTLQLKSGVAQVRSNTWRLNKDLLQDKAIEERIHEELVQFFRIRRVSQRLQCGRPIIRGILIMAGSERKKRMKQNKSALMEEIHKLEQLHKTKRYRTLIETQ